MFFKVPFSLRVSYDNNSILGKVNDVKVSYQDIMASTKIASACDKSAKTGKPVDILWTDEEIPFNK